MLPPCRAYPSGTPGFVVIVAVHDRVGHPSTPVRAATQVTGRRPFRPWSFPSPRTVSGAGRNLRPAPAIGQQGTVASLARSAFFLFRFPCAQMDKEIGHRSTALRTATRHA